MSGPHLHRLANGFTIAADPMAGVETIAIGLHVDCGARHEEARTNGLAHLFEHMVFKGAGGRSARAISEAVENVGGYLNAYTSRDQTAFQARLLAEHLDLGIELIGDLIRKPHFDAGDLAREKDVVLQELGEARDLPDDIINDHFHSTAWPGQAFGRPVLGGEETIAAIGVDDLRAWTRKHYRPENMVLAAAGKIDVDRLVALAEEGFGDMEPAPRPVAELAAYRGGTFVERRRLESAHILFGYEGVSYFDPSYYPLLLFSQAAGEGSSSRLFQSIREERGLAYSVGTSVAAWRDTGMLTVYLATARREAQNATDLSRALLRDVAATLAPVELDRAKAQIRATILMALESVQGRADRLGFQTLVHGAPIDPATIVARIDACTLDEVRAAGARLLEGPETLATVGPSLKAAA
ncbi:insulinase family protein [Sphingomonas histidinilytica]|jgi:predicted Zn-dependent peptidase|uniref:M16 family metallopeptidase n=1 Tax=Rhizorhabdus histidinilytica TaxID=439228 RepID=UPI000F76EE7A|nr:pitrilysin family protein [Rhizorhabdus histidinilytica]MBO9375374.1 insulinase family protein [Rhizorhabdus histidinilytica]QEH77261.1 insulinase family protein [Sphingomonas sp. C8-2]